MLRKLFQMLAIALFFSAGTVQAESGQWVLSEKRGTVNILRSGVSKVAVSGGNLQSGDVISTGKKSRAVLVRGGEYVVVSPNSRLRIAKPKQDGGVIQFFKEMGSALFRIDKKSNPHFGVDTPYLAAVVKGTTFTVTVTESGAAVQVTEGAVQVATRDGGATQLLSPGMIGMVESHQQFRLNIAGPQNRVIDSPNAKPGSIARPAPMTEAKLIAIASDSFEGVIADTVVAEPVSLAKVTGGMVSGTLTATTATPAIASRNDSVDLSNAVAGSANSSNAADAAIVAATQAITSTNRRGAANPAVSSAVTTAVAATSTAATGNSGSNAGDNGVGPDVGNAVGSGAGNGNGNGNGNGAGNGMGNVMDDSVTLGGSPATGNGNGNGNGGSSEEATTGNGNGNSGNANGNGGSSEEATTGNGNGNSGNANGNGGSSEETTTGNGNGNSGNANGNGGSSDEVTTGNGNGNGNGGDDDDDDGDDGDDD